jgi:hypothetical protein
MKEIKQSRKKLGTTASLFTPFQGQSYPIRNQKISAILQNDEGHLYKQEDIDYIYHHGFYGKLSTTLKDLSAEVPVSSHLILSTIELLYLVDELEWISITDQHHSHEVRIRNPHKK